ncbi:MULTISPECIES: enoyl-CoA hydratase-related protein [unclassified Mycobacterium]|uniref:enoyl-CoA hydratase-related protein n=1 Tax=unclassified Mycobacterium TaxID=2642494 RepID=UPI0029C8C636|nr:MULTISPECIES: enoyl-CoA hydratase-related protein [unclassified Mycobacterium]
MTADSTTIDTGTDTVVAEILDGVGILTLNRPERRNALHPEMFDAVPVVLERFADDADVGCVIITGAGAAFCAGGDVRDAPRTRAEGADGKRPSVAESAARLVSDARMVRLLHEMPKVTIAALPGAAVGAGFSIALSTDFRIAARSAKLIPGWGQLAFSGDFGGAWFLTKLVGPSRALQILIEGTPVCADAALAIGLVNKVVEDDEIRVEALAWARSIAAGPTSAWARMKANVADAQVLSLEAALPLEGERMVWSGLTDEHRAAARAWLEAAAAKKAAVKNQATKGSR